MSERILKFVRAVCEAWDDNHSGCVMTTDPENGECDKANCLVFGPAVECLTKLDVHRIFAEAIPDEVRTARFKKRGMIEVNLPMGDPNNPDPSDPPHPKSCKCSACKPEGGK